MMGTTTVCYCHCYVSSAFYVADATQILRDANLDLVWDIKKLKFLVGKNGELTGNYGTL